MAETDYYSILGIDKKSSQDEIKKAYRKLARKLHPDLNPKDLEAKRKFQELNEANEVLSDPVKKKKYDEYRENPYSFQNNDSENQNRNQRAQSSTNSGYNSGNPFEGDDYSSFFESLFGGGFRSQTGKSKYKGEDYNARLQLTLLDAYTTHQQTLEVNGKKIRITIPAGVENGQTINLKGYGGPGPQSGPAGDLLITFQIEDNLEFRRQKNDLYKTVSINLYTAILGGEIMVSTLNGKSKIKVAPGTQNGATIRLKGKGFPVYKKEGDFGDLYLNYSIEIPVQLNDEQRDLFVQLSKLNESKL